MSQPSRDESQQFKQIGNAVPPTLAYHVGVAVRDALLGKARVNESELLDTIQSVLQSVKTRSIEQ